MGSPKSNQKRENDVDKFSVMVKESSVDHDPQSHSRKCKVLVSESEKMVKTPDRKCRYSLRGVRASVRNSRNEGVIKNKTTTSYKACDIEMFIDGEWKSFAEIMPVEKKVKIVENESRMKEERLEECFVPLTKEEKQEIAIAFKKYNRNKVLVSHGSSKIDITGEKLQLLKPRNWLNTDVINLYLELLKKRQTREPQKFLKCHFFNSFFYEKITCRGGYHYENVQRWTNQEELGYDLLECDKIFVPIFQPNHWCLAIINKKEKKFQYLDSLKGVDSQVLDTLARYYVDEVKDKSGMDIDVSSWEREFSMDIPEQTNGYDCGVFMIKYVDFLSRDIELCFSQKDMPYFRRRTARDLLYLNAGSSPTEKDGLQLPHYRTRAAKDLLNLNEGSSPLEEDDDIEFFEVDS